jgi:hypothetical protein
VTGSQLFENHGQLGQLLTQCLVILHFPVFRMSLRKRATSGQPGQPVIWLTPQDRLRLPRLPKGQRNGHPRATGLKRRQTETFLGWLPKLPQLPKKMTRLDQQPGAPTIGARISRKGRASQSTTGDCRAETQSSELSGAALWNGCGSTRRRPPGQSTVLIAASP